VISRQIYIMHYKDRVADGYIIENKCNKKLNIIFNNTTLYKWFYICIIYVDISRTIVTTELSKFHF
jgi:ssDNA-binding Zn-finger/Zn-ribbon topoisomerase 1